MNVGHLEIGPDRFPVAIQGSGTPILFVHGAPGDWRTFAPHAALLADRYRCITFTQRWFGTAEWREDGPPFGTAAHADDLMAVAQALDMGKVALVAWSYGTHPAIKAALDRPDLFSAMLLYEPGFSTFIEDPYLLTHFSRDAKAAWAPIFAARDDPDPHALARAVWDSAAGPGAFDALPEAQRDEMSDSRSALLRLLDQTPPVPLSCLQLNQLLLPATVAWGRDARPCYAIPSGEAANCINGDRFEIADAGHLWPVLRPDGFTRLVDHWLTGLKEAGSI